MEPKLVDRVTTLSRGWSVLPVITQDDKDTVLSLFSCFGEYTTATQDKIKSQKRKMESKDYYTFLLRNKQTNESVGYSTTQSPYQHNGFANGILFDQMFILPENRGAGLGWLLTAHFMHFVANVYYLAITTAHPAPKKIISKHFWEGRTPNPESLLVVKHIFSKFGMHNLPRRSDYECPRTGMDIGESILEYLDIPFKV